MRALLLVPVLALAGCASTSEDGRAYVSLDAISDLHGLAVHPDRPDEVFLATHQGLVRFQGGALARVGASQDDLMGFSMHPTDGGTFWTSGHPRGGGNMGVRQSTDGGFAWTTLWNERVDFHAMAVSPADPSHLWGVWRGEVMHSADGGRTWAGNKGAPQAFSLAPDPSVVTTLYAPTAGGIQRSEDAGGTWSLFSSLAAASLAFDETPGTFFAGTQDGVSKSLDGGTTWTRTSLSTRSPIGFLARDQPTGGTLYAASYDASVYASADEGGSWTTLLAAGRPTRAG